MINIITKKIRIFREKNKFIPRIIYLNHKDIAKLRANNIYSSESKNGELNTIFGMEIYERDDLVKEGECIIAPDGEILIE